MLNVSLGFFFYEELSQLNNLIIISRSDMLPLSVAYQNAADFDKKNCNAM